MNQTDERTPIQWKIPENERTFLAIRALGSRKSAGKSSRKMYLSEKHLQEGDLFITEKECNKIGNHDYEPLFYILITDANIKNGIYHYEIIENRENPVEPSFLKATDKITRVANTKIQ